VGGGVFLFPPPPPPPQLASAESVVAQAKGPVVSLYYSPESRQPRRYLASPNRHGVPLVFLVKKRRPGWVNVYLPTRPNGSTAWIHDWLLTLARNPYRVRVSRRAHTLTVWKGTSVVIRERVAVGRRAAPTPAGIFYISELLQQPNPRGTYGPYAFGLSAHSKVLFSFGGGPGQIGLHGTNRPRLLGSDASHGCVRVRNQAITRLARMLPLGTPVRIS
jgi:lipoprotein-anchoring transpeptidase ErfK/SrfK